MNEQRQIEELAKVEGYTHQDVPSWGGMRWICPCGGVSASNILPNYLNSHDAMQRIIDGLDDEQTDGYVFAIAQVTDSWGGPEWAYSEMNEMLKATPRQKAEAVLKALGKWEQES